jgi:aminocarboxymuconate-semialdehyde decarboxylase
MNIIDAYTHIMPRSFVNAVREEIPSISPSVLSTSRSESPGEISRRIDFMNRHGVEIAVLTLHAPQIWRVIDPITPYMKLCRIANDALAKIVEACPERFIGVATIPIVDDEAVDELRRCIDDLGLQGVQIFSNSRGEPVDSPEHLRLYEAVSQLDLPVWIHPQIWPHHPWVEEYHLDHLFGWPYETTLAMSRIVYSGILEKHPDLKIITHHLGGMIPYYGGRIGTNWAMGRQRVELSKHPHKYFKMFYNDTAVSGSRAALLCSHSFFGADHIVFGADYYPYLQIAGGVEPKYRDHVATVDDIDIPAEDKTKIFETNARNLLKIG